MATNDVLNDKVVCLALEQVEQALSSAKEAQVNYQKGETAKDYKAIADRNLTHAVSKLNEANVWLSALIGKEVK